MTQVKFRTNYNAKLIKSTPSDNTKMTVPGQALTNSEHIKKARMGISDQTVKMIYDPTNAYPDVNAMDIVDRTKMLQGAKALVADLQQKGKQHETNMKLQREAKAKKDQEDQDRRMMGLMEKDKLKKVNGSL